MATAKCSACGGMTEGREMHSCGSCGAMSCPNCGEENHGLCAFCYSELRYMN